ncbi:hypothetical protein HUJ04_000399 [Dendroctonus ponderosae]|nr:hypothetical protein HUJ04_000399 [Dendroctonus ponderosae]
MEVDQNQKFFPRDCSFVGELNVLMKYLIFVECTVISIIIASVLFQLIFVIACVKNNKYLSNCASVGSFFHKMYINNSNTTEAVRTYANKGLKSLDDWLQELKQIVDDQEMFGLSGVITLLCILLKQLEVFG